MPSQRADSKVSLFQFVMMSLCGLGQDLKQQLFIRILSGAKTPWLIWSGQPIELIDYSNLEKECPEKRHVYPHAERTKTGIDLIHRQMSGRTDSDQNCRYIRQIFYPEKIWSYV